MKLLTSDQMRRADSTAIDQYGIPGLDLMERAGSGVAEEALDLLRAQPAGNDVLILCGKGNNGGDGFVAARLLHEAGCAVHALLAGRIDEVRGDARANLDRALTMGLLIEELGSCPDALPDADLIVDALLGTGFSGQVNGLIADLIDLTNASDKPVLAVDLPSGLNADTGEIGGKIVRATRTVTFAAPKLGMALLPGAEYVGRMRVVDIGFPDEILAAPDLQFSLITEEDVAARIPARPFDSHKGLYGHLLVLAGSVGMTGAAAMTSLSALRIGAGLVTLGVPASLNDILEAKLTEVMTIPLPETAARSFSMEAQSVIEEMLAGFDCLAIGPGISRHIETAQLVHDLLPKLDIPCIIDADALNALAQDPGILSEMRAPKVLTPHPGEMSRLIGTPTAEIQSNRVAVARQAAAAWDAIVVLKGARTLIAAPDGQVWINPTGNPGMSAGGAGDVLTGAIAGLIGQKLSALDAAICGVYLHGLAGDIAAEEIGPVGFVASDIQDRLPKARARVLGQ